MGPGLVLVAALVVAGCSNAEEPAVRDAAAAFARADAQARCDLLAPTTRSSLEQDQGASCPEAIGQLPVGRGDVTSVEVWGEEALVHLTDDTLFLTRDDGGWLVSAAACTPGGEGLYECRLEAT
jgi:hypothetical protein